jgi:hypothetical protein
MSNLERAVALNGELTDVVVAVLGAQADALRGHRAGRARLDAAVARAKAERDEQGVPPAALLGLMYAQRLLDGGPDVT